MMYENGDEVYELEMDWVRTPSESTLRSLPETIPEHGQRQRGVKGL